MNPVRFGALATIAVLAFAVPAFAQETRPFTAENGTFEIPAEPQRIVTLNDQILAVPLYEMGVTVAGTSGRIGADGVPFIRGGMDAAGMDFHNTDIAFLGTGDALDFEKIAALQPDLIIGLPYNDPGDIEALQAIAPTVVIDETELGLVDTLRTLADLSGKGESFDERFNLYLANMERTRRFIGNPEDISVALTFTFAAGDAVSVYRNGMGAITRVIEDLGFRQIDLVADFEGSRLTVSPELIEELDADFIFGFYRHNDTSSPQEIFAAYEKFVPGFCQALTACRNNQLILLPGIAFSGTMKGLELALELVESHMAARRYVPLPAAH